MALSENANDATVTRTRLAESEFLQQIANEEAKQIVEDTEAFATANVKENDAEQKHTEEKLNDGSPLNVEKKDSSTSSTPVAASGDLQANSDELERNTGDMEVAPKADGDKPVHSVEATDEVATIPNASVKHTDTQNDEGSTSTMVGSTSNADGGSPTAKDAEVPRRRKTLW
ncbi:Hypothetical Protein FCC1311_084772 [Hondaea fermentalgiana]|uniref:Uncharacterized protein n=1 Tax=Hondaea fermentalgiana TaxID=2315210 RepID=A0A2R5GMX5_9STRA|nr:Hypothetical Protein FCC1311_084772 [Hondaea fermentalgiana]|eukprot:GBG32252.1 Hypothetical Protein FCC1311_084772 [Hondaea fermentalgiana]